MKKKLITISILVIVLVIGIIISFNYDDTNDVYVTTGDTNASIALVVDGNVASSFPSKGKYTVDVSCSNADGSWDYDDWKLDISNLTGGTVSCNVTFTTASTTYLNDYIISLTGTTQGDGKVVEENGYRYEGTNPDNYILFNGELWRIIGVFDSDSHGVSNTNLVKIVRYTQIGGYAWSSSNTNDWSTASLRTLLNTYYYNATDGTDSGYCYMTSTTVPNKCDFTINGINSTYRSMVQQVTWYLGGYSTNAVTADTFYSAERGTDVYGTNATSVTDYIGLMYPSDSAYSVLASSCARTTTLSSYNSTACSGNSWFYQMTTEAWFLNHVNTSSAYVFSITVGTHVNATINSQYGYGVFPTLYLNSSVYVLDGTGDIDDPYIIAMD